MKNIIKSYLKIFLISIITAASLACISLLAFDSKPIAQGFIIGSVCRCTGVFSIINTSQILIGSSRPKARAIGLYVLRYGFYGIAVAASLIKGVNAISLLIGFIIFDVVMYIFHKKNAPKEEAQNL